MGHTRLGEVPKTGKWNELVGQVAGLRMSGNVLPAAASVGAIAARTLDAAQRSLDRAIDDPGVCHTFFLLTQVALASRTSDWEVPLGEHGIRLSDDSTVFDFIVELHGAIDRYISRDSSGATDLSEIAQQSASEALTSLAGVRTLNLFGGSKEELQQAVRTFSTKNGFGELGQRFFGRFVARFLTAV
jgi:hypothetical protein